MQSFVLLLSAVAAVSATQTMWQQCGGQGWTGGTTCVSGATCQFQNPYYSQCLPGTAPASSVAAAEPSTTTKATTTAAAPKTTTPVAQPTTKTSTTTPAQSSTPASSGGGGTTYKASITHYGSGDSFGSPNCQTNTAACGFYTSPGFSAAASQNIFGVGPGAGAGPACGTCWRLTGETDSSGNALSNAGTSIVVMVNNLCPADGNPLCSQNGLSGTNQYGANVDFDLCSDSGASAAFFGNSGVGLALGSAVEVSCSEYSGTVVH